VRKGVCGHSETWKISITPSFGDRWALRERVRTEQKVCCVCKQVVVA